MTYNEFLKSKTVYDYNRGFDVDISGINEFLHDWQKCIVRWAVKKGCAGLFEDCGLGKTVQQIEWLRIIMNKTKDIEGIGLIACPLSVARQSICESKKLNYNLEYVKKYSECESLGIPIFITNYEQLHNFENANIKAIVLDESSILKSVGGKTKDRIISMFEKTPYKLSCTATPSPNDISELGNQVEFLNVCSRKEMLSKFFVNDSKAGAWRLKCHAAKEFYKWMASWSIFIRKPSDIGFNDDGYNLPNLNIEPLWIDTEYIPKGELLPITDVRGLKGRLDVRRQTMHDKIKIVSDKINKSSEQWLVFCKLNDESKFTSKAIDDCWEVKGTDKPEKKNEIFLDFKNDNIKCLCTKPKIGGFGMNFQNAHNMMFIGIDDSFESFYQCIRREYRYGQREDVNVFIALTTAEQLILNNIKRKEKIANDLIDNVVKEMRDFTKQQITGVKKMKDDHEIEIVEKKGYYKAIKGDVCETISSIETESIDMQIFSPPFFSLFTYSPSPRDIGNNKDDKEFWNHFYFLIPELFRVLKPGRVCAVHCMDIPSTLTGDGFIGTKDLRGDIIRSFVAHDYIWDGSAIIPKNPQAQSIRTRVKGLSFKQLDKDSSWSRPALHDYILKFRKPGENKIHVKNGNGNEVNRNEWIKLAGIWNQLEFLKKEDLVNFVESHFDELKNGILDAEKITSNIWSFVNETHTLNTIKYKGDEKHMCPLQLDTISNAIRLWSNPGETIHTPFGGIGSEGYQSIIDGRKAILHELKAEYFAQMIKNLNHAIDESKKGELF